MSGVSSERIPLVDLKAQYRSLKAEIDEAVAAVLERCDFILGESVHEFEREFALYCEAKEAVALDSGISALELGMRALGIGTGDEVITPANSFIASSSAISFTGATPVWVDADPATHNIDPDRIEAAITDRTRAIMPVHLYGQMADMEAIADIAERHGLHVIEDACQAHGARHNGRRAGSVGSFAAFSFYPGKNLGAYGDAGAITTNDPDLAARLRQMRNYGQRKKYDHAELAWNRRMDTIQAAVLRVKLAHLEEWSRKRRRAADSYSELLAGSALTLPTVASGNEPVWHLYVVESDHRDQLLDHLHASGIDAGIHYPLPIHLQEAYAQFGHCAGSFPVTERAAQRVLSLPLYPELSAEQQQRVADAIAAFGG